MTGHARRSPPPVPGATHLGAHGRWAFVDSPTSTPRSASSPAQVDGRFREMIENAAGAAATVGG